ncbi:MAG: alpha-glucosidase/alpha-galactosidase [Anaerolineae bacterium]
MSRRKLVLIGAGSAMFTQGLVADLILSGRPWHLGLVDIDPQALEVAEKLTRRMLQAREADLIVEASTDRRDLLPDADVVVSTIGVGGRKAWELDITIPRKYGIFQPVGDTVMAGGVSRAMRMIPANVEIARDVARLCPHARFFNYSNPMTAICWAVRRATGADVIGLCIGTHEVYLDLAAFIGRPAEQVSYLAAGINHFTWIYDLRWQGQDAWPLVRDRLAEEPSHPFVANNPFAWSLFETYGAYPAVNDRHVVEFFPERFPEGDYYGRGRLGVDVFSIEAVIALGEEIYQQMKAQALGEVPLDESILDRAPGEHAQLVDIVAAIEGDTREMFAANVPNRGAIPQLPDDAVLELSTVATARGLLPVQVPDFPDRLAAPLLRRIAAHELTVEAALSGDRRLFVEALLADGSVGDPSTAERLADELLRAHAKYLPQFA